jgi:hypothetical protein
VIGAASGASSAAGYVDKSVHEDAAKPEPHLRRVPAAKYVEDTYGIPCSPKTLTKYACAARRAFSALSGLGPRRVGSEQDWPVGRSPRRVA